MNVTPTSHLPTCVCGTPTISSSATCLPVVVAPPTTIVPSSAMDCSLILASVLPSDVSVSGTVVATASHGGDTLHRINDKEARLGKIS